MSLFSQHYEELKASGISDEIIDRYFYSVEGQSAQEILIEDALEKLGGHAQQYATGRAKQLLDQSEHVKEGGWICRTNGQIKPDQPRQETQYYEQTKEWVPVYNLDKTPKLIKYESIREKPYRGAYVELMSPVGEARRTSDGNRLVVIAEGGKKAAALASIGYEAIALPGVDMGAHKADGDHAETKELIPALKQLVDEGASFVIAFDQDKKAATRKGVARSLSRLGKLLSDSCPVTVATWAHKQGKGIDDVLVAQGEDFVHSAIDEALGLDQWIADQPKKWFATKRGRSASYKAELKRLERVHAGYWAKPKADVVLNQRYLDKGQLPQQGSVAFVDSPLGTGKTSQYLRGAVEQHRARHPEAHIIGSGYRNILLRQIGRDLDITHWLDIEGEVSLSAHKAIAACPESLHKLAYQEIAPNSLVILDENFALVRHLFGSDTLKNGVDRAVAVRAFRTLLERVIEGGGYVICLEAGMPQIAIDCYRELMPQGTPHQVIRNEFKLKSTQTAFFYSNAAGFTATQSAMVDEGKRICAASDSANQIDSLYRQSYSYRAFHISSKNSSEERAQAFAEDPQREILKYHLEFISYSPTIGAGVSINDPNDTTLFDVVTGYFTHLSSADASQQLKRYRRDVPLHIFCGEKGLGIGEDDLGIFDPEKIISKRRDDLEYLIAEIKAIDFLARQEGLDLRATTINSLQGKIKETALIDKWAATFEALDNFDRLNLKENLKAKLIDQGYKIKEIQVEAPSENKELQKQQRERAIADDGYEFANTEVPELMTPAEAMATLSTHGHTTEEHRQARKCLLEYEFPKMNWDDPKVCEDWLFRNKGDKLNKLRAEFAARNPKAAKSIDRWSLYSKAIQAKNLGTGIVLADVVDTSSKANVYADSGLPKAIDAIALAPYGNDHLEVQRVAKWVKDNQAICEKVLRMRFDGPRSDLALFNSLVRKIGYVPVQEKQKGKDGQREKLYKLADFDEPNRGHMLKSLADKIALKLEQKGETIDGERIQLHDSLVDSNLEARRLGKAQPITQTLDTHEHQMTLDGTPEKLPSVEIPVNTKAEAIERLTLALAQARSADECSAVANQIVEAGSSFKECWKNLPEQSRTRIKTMLEKEPVKVAVS